MLIGIAVDLGFDWWISTVAGVAVAAVCVALFVLIPFRVVRGVLALIAIEGVAIAVAAPFLMEDMDAGSSMSGSAMEGEAPPPEPTSSAAPTSLPFSFFMTHYVDISSNRTRYENTGRPFAKAEDGSTIALTGQGGWDPASGRAEGAGDYVITDPSGAVRERGGWQATRFVSFEQLAGWYGFPIKEEGWQGPPGSASFAGFLKLEVVLNRHGEALLTAWCVMPEVKAPGHRGDGITLVGKGLAFTDYRESEMSSEGMMFYGPAASG